MKKNETREQTLERLARDASKGKGAAKRFESLVKTVARAPKAGPESRTPEPTPE